MWPFLPKKCDCSETPTNTSIPCDPSLQSSDEYVYDGEDLPCIGVHHNDNLTTALQELDFYLCSRQFTEQILFNIETNITEFPEFITLVNNVISCDTINACLYTTSTTSSSTSSTTTTTTTLYIPSVPICSQVWSETNLNVTTYRNGDIIPQVTDQTEWNSLTTGAWCYYNNDPANGAIYGKLYNWYAITDPRGLAPEGWHIPSKSEWETLITCLGGPYLAGPAMREVGTTHWQSPNINANDNSGFTALPTGYRDYVSTSNIGKETMIWSASENPAYPDQGWFVALYYNIEQITLTSTYKWYGMSVRLIKD